MQIAILRLLFVFREAGFQRCAPGAQPSRHGHYERFSPSLAGLPFFRTFTAGPGTFATLPAEEAFFVLAFVRFLLVFSARPGPRSSGPCWIIVPITPQELPSRTHP
ncbi:hypothetical protein [Chondromyces apiculatus]|uniref:hypothetical protein n=1 Tax=Chondromyces apiculatus TaxID=51 RepID=UPI001E2E380E|nr:hypothetical protein [Chondromyces apiculatus]